MRETSTLNQADAGVVSGPCTRSGVMVCTGVKVMKSVVLVGCGVAS